MSIFFLEFSFDIILELELESMFGNPVSKTTLR